MPPFIHIPTAYFSPILPRNVPTRHDLTERRPTHPVQPSMRLAEPTFDRVAKRVKQDLVDLATWAEELARLRRRCDELYEQARTARLAEEYGRAQRRLEQLKRGLKAIHEQFKQRGLGASSRTAKVMLG